MWTPDLEARASRMRVKYERDRQQEKREDDLKRKLNPITSKYCEDRIRIAKEAGVYFPSECPHCFKTEIVRAGIARNVQRYRCRKCQRTFSSVFNGGRELKERWQLMCYRCGGFNTWNEAGGNAGGRKGQCHDCKKRFVQGGKEELDRYGLVLKMRVDLLSVTNDVRAEVYQQAVLAVLEGRGYCWNVQLDVPSAVKTVLGDRKAVDPIYFERKR